MVADAAFGRLSVDWMSGQVVAGDVGTVFAAEEVLELVDEAWLEDVPARSSVIVPCPMPLVASVLLKAGALPRACCQMCCR